MAASLSEDMPPSQSKWIARTTAVGPSAPQSPVSGIVTLHELKHHISRRAEREFKRALAAEGKGDRETAIVYFQKAIAVDPYGATPYSNLALAYLRKEKYDDAERAARRALELDRTGTHGHLTLGMSLVLQAKVTAEMEWSLEKAALDYPSANFWLGIGLLTKGDIHNAKARLEVYGARGEKVGREMARSLMQQLEVVAQNSH